VIVKKFTEWMKLKEAMTSTADVAGFSPRLPIGHKSPVDDDEEDKKKKKKKDEGDEDE
jgi:hypothetical protein